MKRVKLLLLVAVAMILSISLAGCGGDKFAGKWMIQNDEENKSQSQIGYIDIAKNGDASYIVTINEDVVNYDNYWRKTVSDVKGNKDGAIEVSWEKKKSGPYPAKLVGNTISCDIGGFFGGTLNIVHIEKDDSLMMQASGASGVMLKKFNEKDYEALKKEKETEFLIKFATERPDIYMRFKSETKK
ncbi:MAG: hypothetical protein Q4D07_01615 [Selenomonadaceae bacterium]|nr:hypothetical protein [Selenomonadaceae bacterium]